MIKVILILIYTIINGITLWQIHWWLGKAFNKYNEKKILKKGFFLIYVALYSLPILGIFIKDSPLKFNIQYIGNIWLGIYLYLNGFILIMILIRAILKIPPLKNLRTTATCLLRPLGIMAIIVTLLANGYGYIHGRDFTVTPYTININKKVENISTLKIVFLADLHLGSVIDQSGTKKQVEKINALKPDVILIGGDIFNSSYNAIKNPEEVIKNLKKLKATYGVYAVYGNHDVEETLFGGFAVTSKAQAFRSPEMEKFMKACNIRMLEDEVELLANEKIQLIGRLDGEKAGDGTDERASVATLFREIDATKPIIVLEHEPMDYAKLGELGTDLILSGHTHNGQIFPANYIVKLFHEHVFGVLRKYDTLAIVTSGIGMYGPPLRIGTDNEIVEININFRGQIREWNHERK